MGMGTTRRKSKGMGMERVIMEKLKGDTALKGTLLAGVLLVGVVGGFGIVGYIYKDQINVFLNQFSAFIEGYGPAGYALFVAVYAGLEVLAIPAIPLTMSAGLLFGSVIGTILVSISGNPFHFSFRSSLFELFHYRCKRMDQMLYTQDECWGLGYFCAHNCSCYMQFPLVSRSGRIRKLVAEHRNSDISRVELLNLPGGAETFELAAKFCYGINFET